MQLLEKHQGSCHRFIHQVAKNGKEIAEAYRQYLHTVAAQFRKKEIEAKLVNMDDKQSSSHSASAGALDRPLQDLVAALSPSDRATVLRELDEHAEYLQALAAQSTSRTKAVMGSGRTTSLGPGMFLARWQALLDATLMTPTEAAGEVRKGGDSAEVQSKSQGDADGEKKRAGDQVKIMESEDMPKAPNVSSTVDLLSIRYKDLLKSVPSSQL